MAILFLRKSTVLLHSFCVLVFLGALLPSAYASAPVAIYSIPPDVSSDHFLVSINGHQTPVLHAAAGYYLLNFDTTEAVSVSVTASDIHYWDAGVEVQPMRLGIRPKREGATISFTISGPVKLSITRPGDHFAESEMLFLFANKPDQSGITAQTRGVRYYGPGVHRGSINAHSGDTIYIAGGAVVLGSLNLWQVHDVHVLGRGTILYDGPQDPDHDEGWMHKPDWHVIVMDNAYDIDIEGITGIVRSRTWMVQMRDSHRIKFRNVKIIGGSPGNANQDGMDWLGGGDTLVQDSFIRAADDVFAMYGNWDGYDEKLLTTPGHEVSNITIENSVLSTSISNIVRLGWPKKVFDSHTFTMRDSDVIHMGMGGCGVPFALFEVWADPDGKGTHKGYHFDGIRLEDWYSLTQLRQPNPAVREVSFKDIWAMDGPGMVTSVLKGDIAGVSFQGVNTGDSELSVDIEENAQQPVFEKAPLEAHFDYTRGLLRSKSEVTFAALGPNRSGLHYHWLLGDGSAADGREVHHAFPDAQGTLLDGSGRFRVLLHVTDDAGHQSWSSQSVVLASQLQPAIDNPDSEPAAPAAGGVQERYIRVPSSGGYSFTLLTSADASLAIDGLASVHSPMPRPQVCGSPGNAVQPTRLSAALSAGWHKIRVERDAQVENAASTDGAPLLLWEGPGIARQVIPSTAYFHSSF
jgi:PKD domain